MNMISVMFHHANYGWEMVWFSITSANQANAFSTFYIVNTKYGLINCCSGHNDLNVMEYCTVWMNDIRITTITMQTCV